MKLEYGHVVSFGIGMILGACVFYLVYTSSKPIVELTVEECIDETLKLQSRSEVELYYKIHTECQDPRVYLGALTKLRGVK